MGKVTGAGEDRLNDELDVAGADCGLWVSGVDYVAGWRDAREAADRLNRVFRVSGFELDQVRAVASTNADGGGVVRITGHPHAVDRLAVLLASVASDDNGGAA
ncbi:hypothetical protein ABT275_15300 [Streptomyces sp. NPDC001185]|uniref:hypothetical protein n=1 Tax=Streptomyces sp. NPDC001185 TaxID=3154380 RepID=UPI003320C063